MKRIARWAALGLLALFVAGTTLALHTWHFTPLRVEWLYTRAFLQFALDNPELLTALRLFEPFGIRGHNARLADGSEAHETRVYERLKRDLAQLQSYDADSYAGQRRLSYDIFGDFIGTLVRGERWRYHDYPVSPLFGVQSEVATTMIEKQQIADATDAEHYIARLAHFPRRFGELIEGLEARERRGVLPPRFAVDKVLDQIAAFTASGAKENELATSFKRKLDGIPADRMSAQARADLQRTAEAAVAEHVLPAYARLAAHLESLKTKTTTNHGAWSLPDGDLYYQYRIEHYTTTKTTAEALHLLGLAEVDRIAAEMERSLAQIGLVEGTREARIRQLERHPGQAYPDGDDGRAEMLRDYQRIIDDMDRDLARSFNLKPKAKVRVARVPIFKEQTTPLGYYDPAPLDGSAPATFYANLRDVRETPRFRMRTTAYHEALPGHHVQISIAHEIEGLPIFRRFVPYTAYSEGWALYAERLAGEMGHLEDPRDRLGQLSAEMLRAARLVVDTGLHAKRWTREQAIDYMTATSAISATEAETEVERYLLEPGQALAYTVGMLKIVELRERARTALGAEFDLREFHDEVLKNGAMPLTLLEQRIDAYLARKKTR